MSDPDAVLAAIDGAITDFTVSQDAMRWTPDLPEPTITLSAPPSPAAGLRIELFGQPWQLLGEGENGSRLYWAPVGTPPFSDQLPDMYYDDMAYTEPGRPPATPWARGYHQKTRRRSRRCRP